MSWTETPERDGYSTHIDGTPWGCECLELVLRLREPLPPPDEASDLGVDLPDAASPRQRETIELIQQRASDIFGEVRSFAEAIGRAGRSDPPRFSLEALIVLPDGRYGAVGKCDWDEEHGFGVLLEGTRVREVGDQSLLIR